MTSTRFLLVALVSAGCAEDPADPDPDPVPDRLLPGPCTATVAAQGDWAETVTTYSYDAADRLERVERPTASNGPYTEYGMSTSYTRDDTGAIIATDTSSTPDEFDYTVASWTFSDTSVEYDYHYSDFTDVNAEHEVGLRFLGDPLEVGAAMTPESPDSRLHAVIRDIDLGETTELTYTYDGPPRQGTRTQTSNLGGVVTFTYDDDGNLVERVRDGDVDTYRWEAGLLVEVTRTPDYRAVYTRDQFGNLLEVAGDSEELDLHSLTTYAYGCWL